jgi:hypothetical protein
MCAADREGICDALAFAEFIFASKRWQETFLASSNQVGKGKTL